MSTMHREFRRLLEDATTSVTLKPSLGSSCSGTPNPCVVTYTYDLTHDDLLIVDNGTAKITYAYDGLHRVKTERLDVPSSNPTYTGTIAYAYDNASKVTSITYPVGGSPQAVYTYDSLGRPIQVDYAGARSAVLTYDSSGRPDNVHYWQDSTDTFLQEKYSYDARDRVTQVKVFDTGATYMQLDYQYDKASEIVGVTDNMYVSDSGSNGVSNPKAITYDYDGDGRIRKAVGPFGAGQAAEWDCYDYDAVGNIAHWGKGTTSCPTSGTTYYTYNYAAAPAWNKLDSITNLVTSFTYNTAGSIATKTEGGTTATYTHDFLQQLGKIVVGSNSYAYSYDGLGRRVKAVEAGMTSYFIYADTQMLYSKVGGAETAYVWLGEKLLLKKEAADARYYHHDASANVRLVTYYAGGVQVESKFRYKPFGDILVLSGPMHRFQFAQQEYDNATRQYHMGLRYQDPVVGRFVQRDPIGPGYDYGYNNPLSYWDPTGALAFLIVIAVI